jgi:hypothetical protein
VYAVWAAVSLVLFIILTWPQGEHPEKPRTQPSTDAEELVKRITLRNVRDPEAVTFLAWGPNMCHTEWNARAEEGGVAEGWKGKFDAIVRVRFQEPATADLEGRAAAPSSSKAARAEECDLLVAVKDNVVVGHCPNPFGDNWKKDTLAVLPQLFPATNP